MPHSNNLCYEFGPFKLNVAQRTLTRDGNVISLPPKATDILLVLLQNPGELVHKEYLMKEVWPDSFVEEGNLTQNIFTLRRALGDHRTDPQYIETVVRMGYRFIAAVRVVENLQGTADRNLDVELRPITTLAVFPIRNVTGDDGLQYLAEGVTDSIINNLTEIPKLRVMSRSTVLRYRNEEIDPQVIANELHVDAMLLGKLVSQPAGFLINLELVAADGWLLWGGSLGFEFKDILQVQFEIVKQISKALRLRLTGEEQKQIAARYTNDAGAYDAYIEGRFHWSRFTREEIVKAIGHFRRALSIDPNYALAYAGMIDCYVRLIANYLPPDSILSSTQNNVLLDKRDSSLREFDAVDERVKLRYEWDWKGAERELKRARELKVVYPLAHQWHHAYLFVRKLYQQTHGSNLNVDVSICALPRMIGAATLTASEQVQIFCTIAREQIVVGNFEGARFLIERWLPTSGWPRLDHLEPQTAADLLLTLGNLIGVLSLSGRIGKGQKRAESYLNGSIALLAQTGSEIIASEAKIELAKCHYREGAFEEAREVLLMVLKDLPVDQTELRSLCLCLYGCLDRDSGRLHDSLAHLEEASSMESGQLTTGYCHLQLATTLKELGNLERRNDHFQRAGHHFLKAIYEFEAIGNHRAAAVAENNLGYLLLCLGLHEQCESHLLHARKLFNSFSDHVCAAQVNETLTQLHIARQDLHSAQEMIDQAVVALESTDGDAALAEALVTKGVVACRQRRYSEARNSFESAHRVAERRGDNEAAGRALLTMFEEMGHEMTQEETLELSSRLKKFFAHCQQPFLLVRFEEAQARMLAICHRKGH